VKKGETLYSISKQREITVQRLKDLNGLLGNIIEINQWLLFK
jgi:LysM repeat protein